VNNDVDDKVDEHRKEVKAEDKLRLIEIDHNDDNDDDDDEKDDDGEDEEKRRAVAKSPRRRGR